MTTADGVAWCRWIEFINKIMKSRNVSYLGFASICSSTHYLKALSHVDTQYSETYGEGLDTPMDVRGLHRLDIINLVKFFKEMIGDPNTVTSLNPFQGISTAPLPTPSMPACYQLGVEMLGRAGVDIDLGDYRFRRPWDFIMAVARGTSAPIGYNLPASWTHHMQNYLKDFH